MMAAERPILEQRVQQLCAAGQQALAAECAVRGYGPEIYGFLLSLHRDDDAAAEVFARWSEGLWMSLPSFGWRGSLRTWVYAVARNASLKYHRGERRRARRERPLADEALQVAEQVRTSTALYRRTAVKSRLEALRETLDPEDQALLELRVDRQLEWKELAQVLLGAAEPPPAQALAREAQRLRKRYQVVKERLIALARAQGLLDAPDEG